MYAELCDYKRKNGDCLVSMVNGKTSDLWCWVLTQRRQYRLKHEEKPSNLSDEREELLDEIGFPWRILSSWNDRFQQLENVGSCSSSAIRNSDLSLSLYHWCRTQLERRTEWREREREYQRELSSWEKSRRRGDRPTRRNEARYEQWLKQEEDLDQLGFWDEFSS
jgi:hypothetical protein